MVIHSVVGKDFRYFNPLHFAVRRTDTVERQGGDLLGHAGKDRIPLRVCRERKKNTTI